jgi:7-carboxy-7-deazaguanine synthase
MTSRAPQSGFTKKALPLMESFYTLQGEGFHAGRAAYFLRLGGCDVGCVWCDVKESWPADAHPKVEIEEMVRLASENPGRLAVVTGGEPLMYNLEALTVALQSAGFETNIETSGAYPLSGQWDWICISPKKFKAPLQEVLSAAHEFKMVIFHKSDLDWMQQFLPYLSQNCKLYLQPEWSRSEQILPLLIDYTKQNPIWRISLQTHKFLNIP